MNTGEIMSDILGLIAGIGIFMVACETLSENLQAISSSRMKALFSKVSDNKIIGVCIGALTTMLIQSSGATTVMLMGFVNTSIISLNQAATILLGSEIGTTLTGQIVALGMFGKSSFSLSTAFATFIGIGAFINLLAKKDKTKSIGGIMIGFGMIFVGLSSMSNSMEGFAQLDSLKTFIASIDSTVLLIIIGALITALIHSSSAMTSIAITMIAAGLITLEQGIYITLGANVGTCLTGALAALTSGINAKRTSLFQLIFNGGGVVLLAIFDAIIKMSTGGRYSTSHFFEAAFPGVPSTQLAMFHTIFNIVSVLIALPISNQLVKLCVKCITKGSEDEEKPLKLYFFDEKMMSTPSVAVAQIKNEIMNMAEIAINNFNKSIDMITTLDFKKKKSFENDEDELDYLNATLVEIITRLSQKISNRKDYTFLSSTYRVISDLERIGDYSENIIEYAEYLEKHNQVFSEVAIKEIMDVKDVINKLYGLTIEVYKKYDKKKMKDAFQLEETIDELTELMASSHISRMNNGECSAEVGSQYLQLSSDLERIGDHLININDNDIIIVK